MCQQLLPRVCRHTGPRDEALSEDARPLIVTAALRSTAATHLIAHKVAREALAWLVAPSLDMIDTEPPMPTVTLSWLAAYAASASAPLFAPLDASQPAAQYEVVCVLVCGHKVRLTRRLCKRVDRARCIVSHPASSPSKSNESRT